MCAADQMLKEVNKWNNHSITIITTNTHIMFEYERKRTRTCVRLNLSVCTWRKKRAPTKSYTFENPNHQQATAEIKTMWISGVCFVFRLLHFVHRMLIHIFLQLLLLFCCVCIAKCVEAKRKKEKTTHRGIECSCSRNGRKIWTKNDFKVPKIIAAVTKTSSTTTAHSLDSLLYFIYFLISSQIFSFLSFVGNVEQSTCTHYYNAQAQTYTHTSSSKNTRV